MQQSAVLPRSRRHNMERTLLQSPPLGSTAAARAVAPPRHTAAADCCQWQLLGGGTCSILYLPVPGPGRL